MDTDSFHFRNDHIDGSHRKEKRQNHQARFDLAKYKSVSAYEKIKGSKDGQVKAVTSRLNFKQTGVEYNGNTGEAPFLVTGREIYKENGKIFLPEHLDGPIASTSKKTVTVHELINGKKVMELSSDSADFGVSGNEAINKEFENLDVQKDEDISNLNKDLIVTIPDKYFHLFPFPDGELEGTYLLSYDLVNGKKHWIQEKGVHAIWFCDHHPNVWSNSKNLTSVLKRCWMIGHKLNLGSNNGFLTPALSIQIENESPLEEITHWRTIWHRKGSIGDEQGIYEVIIKSKDRIMPIVSPPVLNNDRDSDSSVFKEPISKNKKRSNESASWDSDSSNFKETVNRIQQNSKKDILDSSQPCNWESNLETEDEDQSPNTMEEEEVPQKIIVTMKAVANDAQQLREREGIYIVGPNQINGKAYWRQNQGPYAIWHFNDYWIIGLKEVLGKNVIDGTRSVNDSIGPHKAFNWKYFNTSKYRWIEGTNLIGVTRMHVPSSELSLPKGSKNKHKTKPISQLHKVANAQMKRKLKTHPRSIKRIRELKKQLECKEKELTFFEKLVGVSPAITGTEYGESIHLKMRRAKQNARHEHVMRTIQHRSVGKGHRCLDNCIEKSMQESEYSDALILNVTNKDISKILETGSTHTDDDMKCLENFVKSEIKKYDLEHTLIIVLYKDQWDKSYHIDMNIFIMNESLWRKNFCAKDCDCQNL